MKKRKSKISKLKQINVQVNEFYFLILYFFLLIDNPEYSKPFILLKLKNKKQIGKRKILCIIEKLGKKLFKENYYSISKYLTENSNKSFCKLNQKEFKNFIKSNRFYEYIKKIFTYKNGNEIYTFLYNTNNNWKTENTINWYLKYYEFIERLKLDYGIEISGVRLDNAYSLKTYRSLFFIRLNQEILKIAILGGLFVLFLLYINSRSVTITLSTALLLFMSIVFSIFIYKIVFRIDFFPFVNMVSIVIHLAVGVDDVFIIMAAWKRTTPHLNIYLAIEDSIKNSILSLQTSTFSTCIAILGSTFTTKIPAIHAFGTLTTIGLLFNLILSLTWIPMILYIHSTYIENLKEHVIPTKINSLLFYKISEAINKLAENSLKLISTLIFKIRYTLIVIYILTIITSLYILLKGRPLELSNRKRQLLFSQENILEKYHDIKGKVEKPYMPLTFMWGIKENKEKDNDHIPFYRPLKEINSKINKNFDLFFWKNLLNLEKFCRNIKIEFNMTNYPCLINTLIEFGSRNCSNLPDYFSPNCCNWMNLNTQKKYQFIGNCFKIQLDFLYVNKLISKNQLGDFGYYFDKRDNRHTDLQVIFSYNFLSDQQFTPAYKKIETFYNRIQLFWFKNTKGTNLTNGLFWSRFELYDLQKTLLKGVGSSLSIAFIGTAAVLIISTRQFLISIVSILSLASSVLITISILAVKNWKIGVSDTVCLALGAGLSVDFILHISVLQSKLNVIESVNQSYFRIYSTLDKIGMAVYLAALTSIGTSLIAYSTDIYALKRFSLMIFISVLVGCISAIVMLCLFSVLLTLNCIEKYFQRPSWYFLETLSANNKKGYCYNPLKILFIGINRIRSEEQQLEQVLA